MDASRTTIGDRPPRVAVVGAGISGLATAYRLRQKLGPDASITVLEAASRPGGTAWTEHAEGFALELGPNGFLDNKPTTLELCNELGLADRLVRADPASARRFLFLGDRLRPLPASPLAFLRSGLLTPWGKLRLLCEPWIRRGSGADESIHAFGCRRLGKEAADTLLDAFVTGILAGDPKLLSLPACFPRIAELETEFGSLIKAQIAIGKKRRAERKKSANPQGVGSPTGTLTAPAGGMRTLIEALRQRVGTVELDAPCSAIHAVEGAGWQVESGPRTWPVDAVVLACPAFEQARLLRPISADLADEIGAIPYTSAVVAVVGYRREDLPADLAGFGYLAPQRLGRPVLGVLWSSSIFPDQSPAGSFAFRAILGGWQRRDVLGWSDHQVEEAVRHDLRASLGVTATPTFRWIHRWERAIPQYHVGHLARLERIDAIVSTLPGGLFLTGNAYRGVSLNDCTRDAHHLADTLARRRATTPPPPPSRAS